MKKEFLLILLLVAGRLLCVHAGVLNSDEAFVEVIPRVEGGFAGVMKHDYRVGSLAAGNTNFDFLRQGGQEVLFPFWRISLDFRLAKQHSIIFLYQPLTLETTTVVGRNDDSPSALIVDGVTFPVGTAVDIVYGFDFWRFSYLYDFFASPDLDVEIGVSLQLRNARVKFASTDGSLVSNSQNLGPVPILKFRARYRFPFNFVLGGELDGFYASNAFLNGASYSFTGYIWDISFFVGYMVKGGVDLFLNTRFLGGGASGISSERSLWTESVSGETDNFLATYALTLGVRIR